MSDAEAGAVLMLAFAGWGLLLLALVALWDLHRQKARLQARLLQATRSADHWRGEADRHLDQLVALRLARHGREVVK